MKRTFFVLLVSALGVACGLGCTATREIGFGYARGLRSGDDRVAMEDRFAVGGESLKLDLTLRAQVSEAVQRGAFGIGGLYAFGPHGRFVPHLAIGLDLLSGGRVAEEAAFGMGGPRAELGVTWVFSRSDEVNGGVPGISGVVPVEWHHETTLGLTLKTAIEYDVYFTEQQNEAVWTLALAFSWSSRDYSTGAPDPGGLLGHPGAVPGFH